MRDAWGRGDQGALTRLAHWLNGAGGTAGFGAFTEPARRLERLAKLDLSEDAERALREVEALAGRIVVPAPVPA